MNATLKKQGSSKMFLQSKCARRRRTISVSLKRAAIVLVVLLFPTFAFADISEATFTPHGNTTYERIQERSVDIYIRKPEFKFRVIGVIEARGMSQGDNSLRGQLDSALGQLLGFESAQPGEKEDIALAMRALRQEAALNGAYGVVILKSIQVRVSPNATERRIIAAAIRAD